jgi:hypothetical protein
MIGIFQIALPLSASEEAVDLRLEVDAHFTEVTV